MIALANGESGALLIEQLLADTANQCFAHAANLCEAYYDAVRRSDTATADRMLSDFVRQGVRFRSDMDIPFWKEAAQLKAALKRISLAYCFGLILAKELNADFVSADRHELALLPTSFRISFFR